MVKTKIGNNQTHEQTFIDSLYKAIYCFVTINTYYLYPSISRKDMKNLVRRYDENCATSAIGGEPSVSISSDKALLASGRVCDKKGIIFLKV